ncbi:alpha/beta hydrolase [Marivirga arenosa]|uniref:Alpha/beta hydrolase-fold protein n=1 Tax=Marivirga arenosa TaxID=3059076 RepID=A0AA49J9E7_9BACT|nr:alpha/beta hydrolase-fold protein [Marivirga sp. BKB1-2]WKK80715.2 alpha/beta hydrolase-fold protein [Marivirga sp. BKB1-2]
MKNIGRALMLIMIIHNLTGCNINSYKDTAIKNTTPSISDSKKYEIANSKVLPIKDSSLNRQYELYIKLPENYEKNKDYSYPVIYFTDAKWHMELLSSATEYLLDSVILVGISWQLDMPEDLLEEVGDHVSRYRDYTFSTSNNIAHQSKFNFGGATDHLQFIQEDVISFIEKKYRIDPNNRTYFGYSLGGAFGAYILLTKSKTFNHYILGSPSFNNNNKILDSLFLSKRLDNKESNANIFISYGSMEKELGEEVEVFANLLESKKLSKQIVEGNHKTAFPKTGINSIEWLSELYKQHQNE